MGIAAAAIDFGYGADAERAARLDARVRASLARSLEAVAGALDADGHASASVLRGLAARVTAAPVRPVVFALYTGLVEAIQSDDDAALATMAARLGDPGLGEPAPFRITNLGGDPPGPVASDLYRIMLDDDPDVPIDIVGLDAVRFEAGKAGVLAALALLTEAAPTHAGEVTALCNEVVLGASPGGASGANAFSSASSPYLWGGIQLDPVGASRVALAETLVHEASHCLLNGLVNAGALSSNPPEARYASPLRRDPRPMEGIIHATYVLGRMIMALDLMAASPTLSAAEQREAEERRADNVVRFGHGIAMVRTHGVLTPAGARAMEGCFALAGRLTG